MGDRASTEKQLSVSLFFFCFFLGRFLCFKSVTRGGAGLQSRQGVCQFQKQAETRGAGRGGARGRVGGGEVTKTKPCCVGLCAGAALSRGDTHSLTHPLTHPLTHSLTHSPTRSPTRSPTHSLTSTPQRQSPPARRRGASRWIPGF